MEKAICKGPSDVIRESNGSYTLICEVSMTFGVGSIQFQVFPNNAVFRPLLSLVWKGKIVDAIKAKAAADFGVTVDEVMFQDLSVLI